MALPSAKQRGEVGGGANVAGRGGSPSTPSANGSTAAVPACNWPAIVYGTHGIGMRYVGRQNRAFMKHGVLQDLIVLGLPIGG